MVVVVGYQCDQIWRFLPLWQNFISLWQFNKGFKAFGQILNLFRQILNAIGQIFNIIIGQILKNNLAIWLHCLNIINFASGAFLATDAQS